MSPIYEFGKEGRSLSFRHIDWAILPGSLPVIWIRVRGDIVGVKFWLEQVQRGDAAGHVADFSGLGRGEGSPEQVAFAVAQPLFDDLIAAKRVFPHAGRDVSPVGSVVQVDVASGCSEQAQGVIDR
jgi:hypothetical protein